MDLFWTATDYKNTNGVALYREERVWGWEEGEGEGGEGNCTGH